MALPHDFRAQSRQPLPVNGKGAPLQVSGSKLQENFEYLDNKQIDALPLGLIGDMLYHDGIRWRALDNPGVPSSGDVLVLEHDGTEPYFETYEKLQVSICTDGLPVDYEILAKAI